MLQEQLVVYRIFIHLAWSTVPNPSFYMPMFWAWIEGTSLGMDIASDRVWWAFVLVTVSDVAIVFCTASRLSAQNNSAAAHTPGSFSRFTGQFAQQRDQASQAAGLNLQRYSSAAAGVSTPSVPAAVPPPAAANFFLHSSGSAGSNFQQSWQGLLAQPIAAVGGAASANLLPDNTRSSLQGGNTVSSFSRDADQMMQVPGSSFSQARPSLGISYGTFNTQLSSRGATSGNAFGQDHLAQGSSPYGLEQRSPLDGGSFMQSNLSVGSGQHIGSLSKHGASSGQATTVASDSKRPSSAHALNLPSIVGAAASGTQLQGQFGSFQTDQLQSLQSDHISNSQFNILPVPAGGYGQTFFPGTSFGSMQPGSSQSDFLNQHSSVFESLQGPATFNNMLQFSGTCKSLNMNPMGSSGGPGSVIEGTGGSFNLASLQGAAGQAVQEHMQLSSNNIHDVDSGSLHSPQSRAHPAASHGQGGSGGTTHHHSAAASPDHHQLAIAQHQSNSPINAGAEHERQSSQLQQLDASIDQPTLQETLYRYQSDPDMITTSACCNHHANCDCRSSRYKQHEGHDIKVEFQPPAAASGSHPHDPSSATTSPPPPPPPTSTSQENAQGR